MLPGVTMMTIVNGPSWAIHVRKVVGARVFDPTGCRIGEITDIVLDMESDSILYAVVGLGGYLEVAKKCYAVRWESLGYDVSVGGFVANCTREELANGPAHSLEWLIEHGAMRRGDRTPDHYEALRYWETP
jgi:PRC-barrel domain